MIVINIVMSIRPEKMDDWLALADSYAKNVNSEEGCLFFKFSRSLTDENEFVCIEGFKDADAGATHVQQPYVKKFFDTAPDLVSAQPQNPLHRHAARRLRTDGRDPAPVRGPGPTGRAVTQRTSPGWGPGRRSARRGSGSQRSRRRWRRSGCRSATR